jgi:hypothetical protein
MTPFLNPFGHMPSSLFDESTYFPHHGSVTVFTGERMFPIHYHHLRRICPRIPVRNGEIHLWDWSAQYARRLKSRSVDQFSALKHLNELFVALKESAGGTEVFRSLIYQRLQWALNEDFRMVGHPDGLHHCRRRFVVLAHASKANGSHVLASALATFFFSNQNWIVGKERSRFLGAWGLAVMDIRSKLAPADAANCFRALAQRIDDIRRSRPQIRYYDNRWHDLICAMMEAGPMYPGFGYLDDWDRGRRPQRDLFWEPRARTMPPPMIRQSPVLLPPVQDVVPYHYQPPTSVMDMVPYMGNQVEEVEHLANRQDVLEQRIENLEVDQLMKPY